MLSKRPILKALVLLIVVVILILVAAAIPHRFSTSPDDNSKIVVTKPSFISAAAGSICTLEFPSKSGKTQKIVLVESSFHQPILVLPSRESNVFYCVYDFDTDWQLIKIAPNEPFKSLNRVLNGVVKHSDCRIERIPGTSKNFADWNFAADELDRMSQWQFERQFIGVDVPLIPLNSLTLKGRLAEALRRLGDQGHYGDEDSPVP